MLCFLVLSLRFWYCAFFLLGLRTLVSNVPSYFHHLHPHLSWLLLRSSLLSLLFLSFFALLFRDVALLAVLCAWSVEAEAAATVVVAVIQEYLRLKMVQRLLTPVLAAKTLHRRTFELVQCFGFFFHCSCQAVSAGMRHEKELGLHHMWGECTGHIAVTQRGGMI